MFEPGQHTIPNEESSEFAALFCLGSLSIKEREAFEEHLTACAICRDGVNDCASMLGKWALLMAAGPPREARERFLSRLKSGKEAPNANVLLDQNGILIARSTAMEWKPGAAPGIWAKPLFSNAIRNYGTSLVRMAKGVRYPKHRHVDVEEVYLLSGDLHIEGQILRAGDYCRSEPNSIHNESFTSEGCLFILMSSQLDEVLA